MENSFLIFSRKSSDSRKAAEKNVLKNLYLQTIYHFGDHGTLKDRQNQGTMIRQRNCHFSP